MFARLGTLPIFATLLTVGCSAHSGHDHVGSSSAVNTMCPIMGKEVDETLSTSWNGKTVRFCCAECLPKWNSLSDEDRSAKLAAANKRPADGHKHHGHDDHDHDHAHHGTSHRG